MKITQYKDGSLIVDGERNTVIYLNKNEEMGWPCIEVEGIDREKVCITGFTIIGNCYRNLKEEVENKHEVK